MFLFGHVGFTLVSAIALNHALYTNSIKVTGIEKRSCFSSFLNCLQKFANSTYILIFKVRRVDFRFVVLGSLLPDLVDKPIGRFLFNDFWGNGRLFSHTVAFVVLLLLINFLVKSECAKKIVLSLSFGTLVHIVFDGVWFRCSSVSMAYIRIRFRKGRVNFTQ